MTNTLVLEGAVVVELVGDGGEPVQNELCHVTLPGHSEPHVGKTDARGRFRVAHPLELDGDAKISFPRLDQEAWELVAE